MMPEQLFPADWTSRLPCFTAALAIGYLLGSIPFGLVFGRLAGAGDVRSIGSGNIGATNVLRTGNKWAAGATLICDAGKGAIAVLLARRYGAEAAVLAGFGAFLGHVFPVWLKFRGGKGVATLLGVTLALDWRVGLLACATWLVAAATWRISSLSALIAVSATPLFYAFFREPPFAVAALLFAFLVAVTHRANIARLARGEEPRIGRKTTPPPA